MTVSKLFYNHKNNITFCAPNSLYLQINSEIISNLKNTNNEIITLDDIARNIGFTPSMGSKIEPGRLSKLSNRVNSIAEKQKLSLPKLNLQLLDEYESLRQLPLPKSRNHIFTICISYSQYYKFLKINNYMLEYYTTAEPPSRNTISQHCISLLTTEDKDKNIIIDPNIPLGNLEEKVININSITDLYGKSVIIINENDINTLLTLRYDGLDDDRKIVTLEFDVNSSLDKYL